MKTRTVVVFENSSKKIEFDINPSEISISDSISNSRENIDSLGEVILHGKKGLKSVTLSTFIPASNSPFNTRKTREEIKAIIESWLNSEVKLRFIITNPVVNFKVILDSASMSLKEGSEDLYISLSLSEYKDISLPTVESVKGLIDVGAKASTQVKLKDRAGEKVSKGSEIVSKKTTLWGLACKYYGDGKQWRKIASANGNIDPKKLKEGMKLIIPQE